MIIVLVITLLAALGVGWWYKNSGTPGFDDWDNPRDWHERDDTDY